MKVYFISPIGYTTPMLFDTMLNVFKKVDRVEDADVVFIDMHTRIGGYDYDALKASIEKKKVIFDFWDYGGCEDGTDKFPYIKHEQIRKCIPHPRCNQDIWFVRKLDKSVNLKNVYPIELIQYPDHDFCETSKEEFFNRPYDICFIGNTSPAREKVCKELGKHFKCDFVLGQPRIPHDEWLSRHRQAKLFLTADGGGFSDERAYQLITIAPMLKQKNNQLVVNDFTHSTNCLKVSEHPNGDEINDLKCILRNPDKLYDICLQGIYHMKNYYNAEYRAKYILQILKDNAIN